MRISSHIGATAAMLACAACLLWAAQGCAAQTITARVINGKSGKPLQGQLVTFSLLYEDSAKPPQGVSAVRQLETDARGEVRLNLPATPPPVVGITITLTKKTWHCPCRWLGRTTDVVRNGMLEVFQGEKPKLEGKSIKPLPGEIIFAVVPSNLWEKLLYPFEKG